MISLYERPTRTTLWHMLRFSASSDMYARRSWCLSSVCASSRMNIVGRLSGISPKRLGLFSILFLICALVSSSWHVSIITLYLGSSFLAMWFISVVLPIPKSPVMNVAPVPISRSLIFWMSWSLCSTGSMSYPVSSSLGFMP